MLVIALTITAHITLAADPESAAIAQQLASTNPADVTAGIAAAREQLQKEPAAAAMMRERWLKPLMEKKRFDEILELSLLAIAIAPHDTASVEALMFTRTRALLGLGKSKEALASAKSLFNIASIDNTDKAILLFAECLNAAHAGDLQIVDKFRQEQITGASTQPVNNTTAVSSVVKETRADVATFEPLIQKHRSGRYVIRANEMRDRMSEANLLLLMDQPFEAEAIFVKLRESSAGDHTRAVTENIARALKAEDGTIGRANAFLLRANNP